MFYNDYFLLELFQQRQQELWEEARLKRLIREHQRSRSGSRQRLTRKFGSLLIALGHRLKPGWKSILLRSQPEWTEDSRGSTQPYIRAYKE